MATHFWWRNCWHLSYYHYLECMTENNRSWTKKQLRLIIAPQILYHKYPFCATVPINNGEAMPLLPVQESRYPICSFFVWLNWPTKQPKLILLSISVAYIHYWLLKGIIIHWFTKQIYWSFVHYLWACEQKFYHLLRCSLHNLFSW